MFCLSPNKKKNLLWYLTKDAVFKVCFFFSQNLALQDFWNTFFFDQFLGGHKFSPGFFSNITNQQRGKATTRGHESLGSQEHHIDVDFRISSESSVTNGDGPGSARAVRLWFGCLSLGQGGSRAAPCHGGESGNSWLLVSLEKLCFVELGWNFWMEVKYR